jgi:DNA-binding SARP family transcriptional activator
MRFGILGPLYVGADSRNMAPTAPKPRQVLATLLLDANRMVSTDVLIRELWGEKPPRSALSTLQTYIFQIRRALRCTADQQGDQERQHIDRIVTMSTGYMLTVSRDEFDLHRFEDIMASGKAAMQRGDNEEGAALVRGALRLWRGQALCDVQAGAVLGIRMLQLGERWFTAQQLRITADMRLGRHLELIAELRVMIAEHSHNEELHALLMLALYRSGRRGEALRVYRDLRRALIAELGIDPSARLQRINELILRGEEFSALDIVGEPQLLPLTTGITR